MRLTSFVGFFGGLVHHIGLFVSTACTFRAEASAGFCKERNYKGDARWDIFSDLGATIRVRAVRVTNSKNHCRISHLIPNPRETSTYILQTRDPKS